ncbi:hypothetical protein DH09_18525 [Bacillaceae bacterium JMAK1]|nr:hypothetical protein DH09_18525 [Bacillaceae bacterium JMAK1]
MDIYQNYKKLSQNEKGNYRIRYIAKPTMFIAPHGGGIEPGTSELALYSANVTGGGYYVFEGLKRKNNETLHLTSTNFDEPIAVSVVKRSSVTVAFHGLEGNDRVTWVGGRDVTLAKKIASELKRQGFSVKWARDRLKGTSPLNIVNRNQQGQGVQLEVSLGERQSFFTDFTLNGRGRSLTPRFLRYVAAIQKAFQGQ